MSSWELDGYVQCNAMRSMLFSSLYVRNGVLGDTELHLDVLSIAPSFYESLLYEFYSCEVVKRLRMCHYSIVSTGPGCLAE